MTKNAVRLTFASLLVVAGTGVWLRAMPFLPAMGLPFENLRHAHSHLAFLGWVFSAFYLALSTLFLPKDSLGTPRFQQLFWLVQLVNGGMFVSFLIDGYGAASIAMLTLHTLLACIFFVSFLKKADLPRRRASSWFVWAAVAGFLLSSLGPLGIPFIQVFGGGSIVWTKAAIHFYLHFHYNGWFVFGLLAILLKVFENEGTGLPTRWAAWPFGGLVAGAVLGFFLTAQFVEWPPAIRWGTGLGVLAQWAGLAALAVFYFKKIAAPQAGIGFLLPFSLCLLFLKFTFEMLTVLKPVFALVQSGNHFLTIGWLHLLFLGSVTPFFLWFFSKNAWGNWTGVFVKTGAIFFVAGFLFSELALFSTGLGYPVPWLPDWLLAFSALLFTGLSLMLPAFFQREKKAARDNAPDVFFAKNKSITIHDNA